MSFKISHIKQLLSLFIFFSITPLSGQIVGNGKMVTQTYELEYIYNFEAGIYADITIDMAEESGITVTAEENIIEYIGMVVTNGNLILDQKKWIEPSKRIKIVIGAPKLRGVDMGTHDDLKVININRDIFNVDAEIGNILLSGKVDDLRVNAKNGSVDASQLTTRIASVTIEGDGRVLVNVTESIKCNLSDAARLTNQNKSVRSSDCEQNKEEDAAIDTRYIDIKIKNNSWSRKHFVVVGPKPNGRKFSYGFPMMPGTVKTERWTIGTKVYKEGSLGARELLVTLSAEDEGRTVKLFD